MGEAQDRFEAMRERMHQQSLRQDELNKLAADMRQAMYDLANDMTYPVDQDGNVMDLHWLIPLLSFHLARCGYRKHGDEAVITQIPHPRAGQPGFAENAVLYVPVDTPGEIPKAFVPPPEEDPGRLENQPWRVKTHITVDGETVKGKGEH